MAGNLKCNCSNNSTNFRNKAKNCAISHTVCLPTKVTGAVFPRKGTECEMASLTEGERCKKGRTGEEEERLHLKLRTSLQYLLNWKFRAHV